MPSGLVVCAVPGDADGKRERFNYPDVISNDWKQINQRVVPNAGNLADWKYQKPDGKNDGTWVKTPKDPTGSTACIITADGAGGGNSRCVNGTYIRTIVVGGGTQRWLNSEITGFQIDWRYTRDGNNSVAPWKFGAWFETSGGSKWIWSSSDVPKGSKETWYRFDGSFDGTTLSKLNSSSLHYGLKYIMVSVGSNRNGTGGVCRESEFQLKNLRFKWKMDDNKKHLLLPAPLSQVYPIKYY